MRWFPKFLSGELQPETEQYIDRLTRGPWFLNLGQASGAAVYSISNWPEALEYLVDPEEYFLSVRNEYSSRLSRENNRDFQDWNKYAVAIKSRIEAPIGLQIERLELAEAERTRVRDICGWCVLHAGIEHAYREIANYGRFAEICVWLERGNLPCGWKGRYPAGELAVF